MKLTLGIRFGAWLLIALNLMMAFGAIWVFIRMAPAIETIIIQNLRSLQSCEEMLAKLALAETAHEDIAALEADFVKALERAKNNITEKEEPIAIGSIAESYSQAFAGDMEGRKKTIKAIKHLSDINRNAMVRADGKARQFGNAGAWGIVFMESVVFMVGLLFLRGLKRSLVKPLEEIHAVTEAVRAGDTMRRCTGPDAPRDIKTIYNDINDLLDKNEANTLSHRRWGN